MRALDRRYLLLGDWNWLVRDPLDVLRLGFFVGTVAFAVMRRSTAVGLTAASVLLLVVRIVNLPRRFDLGVIVAMTLIRGEPRSASTASTTTTTRSSTR